MNLPRAFVLCLLLVGCSKSGTGDSTRITMTFDATVTDTSLGDVKTLVLHATGDDPETFPVTLGRVPQRTESVVYRPASSTHMLGMDVDAVDMDGHVLASGSAAPIAVGGTLAVTLSGPGTTDGGVDLGASDFAVLPPPPAFVNVVVATAGQGETLSAAPPGGTSQGKLLLALVAVSVSDNEVISVTPPSGWSTLASTSSSTGGASTASWFYRIASDSEPTSYEFTRTNTLPSILMIASYSGVNTTNPFDVIVATAIPNGTPYTVPDIHTGSENELVVINAMSPDDLSRSWGSPSGYVARQTSAALSADQAHGAHGDVSGVTLPSTPTTGRALTLITSLRSM